MKKKILIIVAILCVFTVSQVHAFGLGAQVNMYAGDFFAPGFSLLFSPSKASHIAANWYISGDTNIIGLTWDVCPLSYKIAGSPMTLTSNPKAWSLNFTLGLGLFSNLIINDEKIIIAGGLRIPVGVNFFLAQNFEIFTHIAPSFGVEVNPSLEFSSVGYPIAVGARLWFN